MNGACLKSLIVSGILITLVAWVLYTSILASYCYLSDKKILLAIRDLVFQTRPEGRNAILGDMLQSSYPDNTTCFVADEVWPLHRIIPREV